MNDPPGAAGDLGLGLLARQTTALEDRADSLDDGTAQPMRQRFQPMREALERHAFYAGLLERACEDAATNVRTNYLLWKADNAYKTNADILVQVLAELVIGIALDSPTIQKGIGQLIGRTLSLADTRGRMLASQGVRTLERGAVTLERRGRRATAQRARRSLADTQHEMARVRDGGDVSPDERAFIASEMELLEPLEEAPLGMEGVIFEHLAATLDVPLDSIIELRSAEAIVEAVERHRRVPLRALEARRLAQEQLAREAALAVEASTRVLASGRPRSVRALETLRALNEPSKQISQEQYLKFATDVTMELRAVTKGGRAAQSSIASGHVILDTGGQQSDPMLAVLDRVIGGTRQQLSAYQELVLQTRMLVDNLLELRALSELQAAADDCLAEVATFVNGWPSAAEGVARDIGKNVIPGYNVGAGPFRASVAYEVELVLWALVLAPLIPARGVPHVLGGNRRRISEGIPDVALDYLVERFARKISDEQFHRSDEVPSISAAPLREAAPGIGDNPRDRICLVVIAIDSAWRRRARAAGFDAPDLPYIDWFPGSRGR